MPYSRQAAITCSAVQCGKRDRSIDTIERASERERENKRDDRERESEKENKKDDR